MKKLIPILLALCLCASAACADTSALPEPLVGDWAGRGTGDQTTISLNISLHADGTAHYVFDQLGYHEEQDVLFVLNGDAFTMTPTAGGLGSTGTYEWNGKLLTLHIAATLASGRIFA